MDPDSVLRASVIVLGVMDLVLIVVCAVAEARVNELRKALASLAGQHQGSSPALETTPSGAGPEAESERPREPKPVPTPAPRVVSPAGMRRKLERKFAEKARDAETLRRAAGSA